MSKKRIKELKTIIVNSKDMVSFKPIVMKCSFCDCEIGLHEFICRDCFKILKELVLEKRKDNGL